jgi:hypothetical protein
VHRQALERILADAQRWFLGDPRPAAEFHKSRGYYAAGPEALITNYRVDRPEPVQVQAFTYPAQRNPHPIGLQGTAAG